MASKIIDLEYIPVAGKQRAVFVLDSDKDVSELSTDYAPGSMAIVAAKDGGIYMLNASDVWNEI